jgi:hypothetical protein
MKKSNYLLGLALAAAVFQTTALAADVGVSISVYEPGFYGRIDLGRAPAPVLIYPQPIIIEQRPVTVVRQPIYLRVPPGHEKNWNKHCRRYNACGQPVYFVQDNWYREVYAPRAYVPSERRVERRVERRDDRRDDRRDERRDDRHDNGHNGKDKHKKGNGKD